MRRGIPQFLFIITAGFASGLIGGLLGAGGGIVAAYAFGIIFKNNDSEGHDDERVRFANTLALMLPLSIISAVSYALGGAAMSRETHLLSLPAIVGGAVGGLLLGRINPNLLRLIFSLLVVWSGISMLIRG